MAGIAYFILCATLSICLATAGVLMARRSKYAATIAAGVALMFIVFKAVLNQKPTWEVGLFPWPDYIYLQGYWLWPVLFFFFGLAIPQLQLRRDRIAIGSIASLMFLWSLWTARWMVFPPDVESSNRAASNHTCRQSTLYTCAPASCVSLLSFYGVDATEGEMAKLCLTYGFGTTPFNTYRGLVLKLRGLPYEVKMVDADLDTLKRLGQPAIVGDWMIHAIVVRIEGDQVLINDPLGDTVRSMPIDEFAEDLSGTAIVVIPST